MTNNRKINSSIAEFITSIEKGKLTDVSQAMDWKAKAEKEIADRKNLIYDTLKAHTRAELLEILDTVFNAPQLNESSHCQVIEGLSGIELEAIVHKIINLHQH